MLHIAVSSGATHSRRRGALPPSSRSCHGSRPTSLQHARAATAHAENASDGGNEGITEDEEAAWFESMAGIYTRTSPAWLVGAWRLHHVA